MTTSHSDADAVVGMLAGEEMPLPEYQPSDALDLRDRIDGCVGRLTVVSAEILAGGGENHAQAATIDQAMLTIAGLEGVVTWEPDMPLRPTPLEQAKALRQMASVGPRPPSVVSLLLAAAHALELSPDVDAARHAAHAENLDDLRSTIHSMREELANSAERLLTAHRRIGMFAP